MAHKRTPNQIEFDKQIKRINRILKGIQKETGISFSTHTIDKPKRITKQKIRELKEITPKVLRSAIEQQTTGNLYFVRSVEIKTPKKVEGFKPSKPRNRSLEAILRNSKRVKRTPAKTKSKNKVKSTTQPKAKDKSAIVNEGKVIIDKIYETLYDWVFNIEGAHEGYEDVKRADRDLVWAIIGRARAELGDEQVALNIRNSGADVEGIINRIIYGSEETTIRFDVAELSRIVNGRSLTVDESKYLTELFENRTFIEFDEEDFETDSPYFATLKGYDGEL